MCPETHLNCQENHQHRSRDSNRRFHNRSVFVSQKSSATFSVGSVSVEIDVVRLVGHFRNDDCADRDRKGGKDCRENHLFYDTSLLSPVRDAHLEVANIHIV